MSHLQLRIPGRENKKPDGTMWPAIDCESREHPAEVPCPSGEQANPGLAQRSFCGCFFRLKIAHPMHPQYSLTRFHRDERVYSPTVRAPKGDNNCGRYSEGINSGLAVLPANGTKEQDPCVQTGCSPRRLRTRGRHNRSDGRAMHALIPKGRVTQATESQEKTTAEIK